MTAELNPEDNFSESMEKLKVMVHNQGMDAQMNTNSHDSRSWDVDEDLTTLPLK